MCFPLENHNFATRNKISSNGHPFFHIQILFIFIVVVL